MSRKAKLHRFAAIAAMPHVCENFTWEDPKLRSCGKILPDLRGKWNTDFFETPGTLILELACGGGEYTVACAQLVPEANMIGVDIKGARIFKGARRVEELQLKNAAFVRTRIEQLAHFFGPAEIDAIWITFPDPFPSSENRRLMSPRFLEMYQHLLKPGGLLHLKTDDPDYYQYSKEQIRLHTEFDIKTDWWNIYARINIPAILKIHTAYEVLHLSEGKQIGYLEAIKK